MNDIINEIYDEVKKDVCYHPMLMELELGIIILN